MPEGLQECHAAQLLLTPDRPARVASISRPQFLLVNGSSEDIQVQSFPVNEIVVRAGKPMVLPTEPSVAF